MSIFYGFLKLINFPPFVRNSWHRHKPWRKETLPTGCMSKLSGFQSQISGGTARFHVLPMKWGESVSVRDKGGIISRSYTSLTACLPLAGVIWFPTASSLGCLHTQSHFQDGEEPEMFAGLHRPIHLQCPCQMRGHRLGIWFFSASQVPILHSPPPRSLQPKTMSQLEFPSWRRKSP